MHPRDFPTGYQALRELGEGSMGTVWLARSERTGGHCAIKVLSLRNDRRGSAERSFNREVRAMARLSHPGVTEVHDYGRTPKGSPFVAMEYVPGASLHAYARGPWSWGRLWNLIDGLLGGLAHAHARGLVHRDLKPGNVLLMPDGVGPGSVKLVDFGIALAAADASRAARRIEGTPAYIAPEAAKGDVAAIGPWTDVYSLGVLLFEILTGDLPFHGRHLLAHHQRSPLPPVDIRPAVKAPAALAKVVERMLEKSPVRRLRSVADVRGALASTGSPPTALPFGPPPSVASLSWLDDEPETLEAEVIQPIRGAASPAIFHLRQPPIAGRESVQRTLREAARAALDGAGPRVVLLEGEPGVGKSRLASWLREGLEEGGRMRTLTIRSEPQTRTGGGLRQALLRSFGVPLAVRDDAERIFIDTLPDEAARRNAIEVLWPAADENLADEGYIARAARVVRDVVGDDPFMLWVDDAQWSPEGRALRLVDRLARPDGPQRLVMVVTLRPSQRSTVRAARRALVARPNTELVEIGPISPRALAPALDALAPLPPGIAEAACVQAAGNPLIALEAVRSYLEAEGLGSAPSDPGEVLQQRIDRATQGPGGSDLRCALARATLLGRSFTLQPLVKLCAVPGNDSAPGLPMPREALESLVERAVAGGLAVEQGPGRWRFSHDLVRAQFRQICREAPNWSALNLAAAEIKSDRGRHDPTGIELEMVARHRWEGQQHTEALRLGIEGVTRLTGAGLMGHSSAFVRRLLDWDDRVHLLTPTERGELRMLGSDAAEHAGQPQEAERHALAAVGVAQRNRLPALGARAASRVGVLKIQEDDTEAAERWLWDALRFARQSGDPKARSNAHLSLGRFYEHRDQYELALTAFEASLESARTGDLVGEELAARAAVARIDRLVGRLDRAVSTFDELASKAQASGREVAALDARLQLGLCAWANDDPVAAQAAFEEVRSGARGNLFVLEFYACVGEAWALAAQRRWTDAEMVLMQAEDLRYDVRLHDTEAERLRRALRDLAVAAHRDDLVTRIDKLDMLTTRTQSAHGSDRTRPD